jgi:hypothetical protein
MMFPPSEAERQAAAARLAEIRAQTGGDEGAFGAGARVRGTEAAPGSYRVRLSVNGKVYESTIVIREDPAVAGIEQGGLRERE